MLAEPSTAKGAVIAATKGTALTGAKGTADRYVPDLADHYPATVKDSSQTPTAVDVYRAALAKAEDHSVAIASIGITTNMRDLLRSQPDKYSTLDGTALVARKVKLVVWMNGLYNFGCAQHDEDNWLGPDTDCRGSAKAAVEGWPSSVKQIFSGVGGDVMHGDWRIWWPFIQAAAKQVDNKQIVADPLVSQFNESEHFLRILTEACAEYVVEVAQTGTDYRLTARFLRDAEENLSFAYVCLFLFLFGFKFKQMRDAVRANDSQVLDLIWRENLASARAPRNVDGPNAAAGHVMTTTWPAPSVETFTGQRKQIGSNCIDASPTVKFRGRRIVTHGCSVMQAARTGCTSIVCVKRVAKTACFRVTSISKMQNIS